jgi:type I restriction enzyme S subunit
MFEWEHKTLGELVSLGKGIIQTGPFGSQLHASDYVEVGIPCLMPSNMKNNRIDISVVSYISLRDAKRLSKHLVKAGDIIYSRRGDVTLKALITDQEEGFFCGTGCLLVRPGNSINSKYLFYFLSTPHSKEWIKNHAVGITMPNLNTNILGKFPITFPDDNNQLKIASVLSILDSKIELNNRINAEFEAMAKTLYDYWFVQFDFPDENGKPYKTSGGKMVWNEELKRKIPEGWEIGTMLNLGEIIGGSTPPREKEEYFSTNGTAWITPKDLSLNTGNKFITKGELDVSEEGLKVASLNIMPKGTILLSSRAPIGYLAISRENVTTNQGFKSFVPNKGFPTEFVYYAVKNLIPTIENNAVGSTFKEVSASTLKTINVFLPPKVLVEQYRNLVSSTFQKQNTIELENQKLTELRDWLLPMLMNGQVKVGDSDLESEELLMVAES